MSTVVVSPKPQAVPGSNPICPKTSTIDVPFLRTTASSPLKPRLPEVSWAVILEEAEECLITKVAPAATVPVNVMVEEAVALPFE